MKSSNITSLRIFGYPQMYHAVLSCFSYACMDKPEREHCDKVTLPHKAFTRISTLRLKYPLYFKISAHSFDAQDDLRTALAMSASDSFSSSSSSTSSSSLSSNSELCTVNERAAPQITGVLEFTAPEEHIFMPYWMMENLGNMRVKIFV